MNKLSPTITSIHIKFIKCVCFKTIKPKKYIILIFFPRRLVKNYLSKTMKIEPVELKKKLRIHYVIIKKKVQSFK